MIDGRLVSHFQNEEPFLEEILRQIRFLAVTPLVKQNSTVLDLGCGFNGRFLKRISKKIKEGTGYDVSVKKEPVASNIKLFPKQIEGKLTLPRNHFDLITSMAVFEHLGKTQTILNNSYRALKKGGIFVITTPNPKGKPLLDLLAFKLKLISQVEISDHKHYYTPEEIRKLFLRAGFKKNKINISYFWFGCNIMARAAK